MKTQRVIVVFLIGFALIITIHFQSLADDLQAHDEIGRTTSQLVELRKFHAQTYNISVASNVKIELVRIVNPKLANGPTKRKRPILFIHGIISSSNYFLVNSINARPRDWTNVSASNLSESELNSILSHEPSSNSLPFLMSNLGHDVWLVNRRSTLAAQTASSLSFVDNSASLGIIQAIFTSLYDLIPSIESLNQFLSNNKTIGSIKTNETHSMLEKIPTISDRIPQNSNIQFDRSNNERIHNDGNRGLFNDYWNFSLDEQAMIDLPTCVNFILEKNPQSIQVSTVSHSTGGAIMLMALSKVPNFEDKIGRVVLWAPAMNMGRSKEGNFLIKTVTRLEPALRSFEGPIRASGFAAVTELAMLGFCQTGQLQGESCESMTDAFDGIGSNQLNSPTGFSLAAADATGSHELAQLLQSIIKGKMHHFDFGTESRNIQAYQNPHVSVYNTEGIKMRGISIWQGNTDALVTLNDTMELVESFSIPVDYRYIDGPGLKFDHSAFLLHKNVSSLLNIPTLKYLESD